MAGPTNRQSYAHPSSPSRYEIQDEAGNWWELKGMTGWTQSGGDKESSTEETLDGGVQSSTGAAGPKQIAAACRPPLASKARQLLLAALDGSGSIAVRMQTAGNTERDNETAADTIAYAKMGGVLTGAAGVDFTVASTWRTGIGITFKAGQLFVLEKVNSATKAVASVADGADEDVAATANWSRVAYGVMRTYQCQVISGDNLDLQTGANVTDAFTLVQTGSGRTESYVY